MKLKLPHIVVIGLVLVGAWWLYTKYVRSQSAPPAQAARG
jgi:hypothetical protein